MCIGNLTASWTDYFRTTANESSAGRDGRSTRLLRVRLSRLRRSLALDLARQVRKHVVHVLLGCGFDQSAGDGGQHPANLGVAGIADHRFARIWIGEMNAAASFDESYRRF